MLTVFFVSRGAHAAQLAALKRWLEQVRGIHCAAGCGARTDHSMDFVDEENRIFVLFQLVHHGFQAFLKVAAIAGACQKRAHI